MYQTQHDFEEDKILRANTSYRALWASVLLQAIRDVDNKEERYEALDYLHSFSEKERSFNWICDMLDLDTERIRTLTLTHTGRRKLLGGNVGNRTLGVKRYKPQDTK